MTRGKKKRRRMRHQRIIKHLKAGTGKTRLMVRKSLKYVYAVLIDDQKGRVIWSVFSGAPAVAKMMKKGSRKNLAAASLIGKLAAEAALKAGHQEVVFDRGGYLYHGRVKALAEAAREAGLKF